MAICIKLVIKNVYKYNSLKYKTKMCRKQINRQSDVRWPIPADIETVGGPGVLCQ